jgi:N6-L-threonylcarbamoyladenine synthase
MAAYLGIDTSAYTTSAALVDKHGTCLADERRLLVVKSGERGLRQSEAFFQHVNALPECLEAALAGAGHPEILGIAVSTAPRDLEGSYMPVFHAGLRIAEALASALQVPLLKTNHQDGHLMAGCHHHLELLDKPFLAVHLSGGTTEILSCRFEGQGFKAELLGGTLDLSFGQLIDRVGVRLGLPFPAGKQLEALTLGEVDLKPAAFPAVRLIRRAEKEIWFNLSGLENKAYALLESGEKPADVAAGLIDRLAETVTQSIQSIETSGMVEDLLIIGGVASNLRLRERLTAGFNRGKTPLCTHYATVAASSDNALGVALLARHASESHQDGGDAHL